MTSYFIELNEYKPQNRKCAEMAEFANQFGNALCPDKISFDAFKTCLLYTSKLVTKAGIIRLLKAEPYGLSDWMARQVYADSLNFFYTQDNVRPQAFANLYAEKAENWARCA